jgi:hypothetical protein
MGAIGLRLIGDTSTSEVDDAGVDVFIKYDR